MNVRVEAVEPGVARVRDFVVLAKPHLSSLIVLTALAGFGIGSRGRIDGPLLLLAMLGTALAAAGAAALNMLAERVPDALMRRTQDRPLPAGRMRPAEAATFGVAASVTGVALLAVVNPVTAGLGAATIVLYLLAYTPLKSRTSLCTLVGAVPGALPPVIGWTAATGHLGAGAAILFALQFLWQLPHFLAIGWMYREDYARAGHRMLPMGDADGRITGRQVIVQVAALGVMSALPWAIGMAGGAYLVGALTLGGAFFALGMRFAGGPSKARAKALFVGSIIYQPMLMMLLVVCQTGL